MIREERALHGARMAARGSRSKKRRVREIRATRLGTGGFDCDVHVARRNVT